MEKLSHLNMNKLRGGGGGGKPDGGPPPQED